MKRLIKRLILTIKNRKKNIRIGKDCSVSLSTNFEGMNTICDGATVSGEVGYGTYVGYRSVISGKIGRFCSIGNDINIIIGSHPSRKFVSTHPVFYSQLKQSGETFVNSQKFTEVQYADYEDNLIIIGNDVWIGSNTLLYSGITIGDGAIIAAGAVVTMSVEPYSIVGGIPAKLIRKRFSEAQIERLLEIQWWNNSLDWIRKNAEIFDDINQFLNIKDYQSRGDIND